MAPRARNNQSEEKGPRRSSRTRNEPDRFVIPVEPPKTKKSCSAKGRARKEAAVKTAAATQARKEKPKKAAKARKAAKKAEEPKPKVSRKRARQAEDDQDDEPRPAKRGRAVANIPRRRTGTRTRPAMPTPSPPPPPPPKMEEDRTSAVPTEAESEFEGTGTVADLQLLPGQEPDDVPVPDTLGLYMPADQSPPASPGPLPPVPQTPPIANVIFIQGPSPDGQNEPPNLDPPPVQTPLRRSYAFVNLGNQH